MNENIIALFGVFSTAIVLGLGIPLVRAYARRQDRAAVLTTADSQLDERLARMENAIEAIAVEVERISEGQRFVTRLLAERERPGGVLPSGAA